MDMCQLTLIEDMNFEPQLKCSFPAKNKISILLFLILYLIIIITFSYLKIFVKICFFFCNIRTYIIPSI